MYNLVTDTAKQRTAQKRILNYKKLSPGKSEVLPTIVTDLFQNKIVETDQNNVGTVTNWWSITKGLSIKLTFIASWWYINQWLSSHCSYIVLNEWSVSIIGYYENEFQFNRLKLSENMLCLLTSTFLSGRGSTSTTPTPPPATTGMVNSLVVLSTPHDKRSLLQLYIFVFRFYQHTFKFTFKPKVGQG